MVLVVRHAPDAAPLAPGAGAEEWTYRKRRTLGRPPLDPEIKDLIVRLGWESPRWGCVRIEGQLRKLGIGVGATIRTILGRAGLAPAPRRAGPSWTEFLRAQAKGILAMDLFTVETAWLRTLHVLFCIELKSRRVHIMGVTRNPDSAWVVQQAATWWWGSGFEAFGS